MTTYQIQKNIRVLSFTMFNGIEIEYIFNGEVKYFTLDRENTLKLLKKREDIEDYFYSEDYSTIEFIWENEFGYERKTMMLWEEYCISVGLYQWQALDIVVKHEAKELLKKAIDLLTFKNISRDN